MSDIALQTRGLGVKYGTFHALSEVDLDIRRNSVHSIIGPNGAGKTTLFHALTGRVPASSGRVVLEGRDPTFESLPVLGAELAGGEEQDGDVGGARRGAQLRRHLEAGGVEDLRPEVGVQAAQLQAGRPEGAPDGLEGVAGGAGEPELDVLVGGGDVLVGVGLDTDRDPQQALRPPPANGVPIPSTVK